jgi:hypothetical protein
VEKQFGWQLGNGHLPYKRERGHTGISVRPYKTGESPDDDPFMEEVLNTGLVWPIP